MNKKTLAVMLLAYFLLLFLLGLLVVKMTAKNKPKAVANEAASINIEEQYYLYHPLQQAPRPLTMWERTHQVYLEAKIYDHEPIFHTFHL